MNQEIVIPKGVDTGTVLRIPKMGHGNADLLVNIKVGTHPYFKRDGFDIHTNQIITISQAVLGATIDIITIHGKKNIKINPGTASGAKFKIAGYGVQKLYPNQHSRGDHYVHLNIKVPSFLNHKQKEAMKAYAAVEEQIVIEEPNI